MGLILHVKSNAHYPIRSITAANLQIALVTSAIWSTYFFAGSSKIDQEINSLERSLTILNYQTDSRPKRNFQNNLYRVKQFLSNSEKTHVKVFFECRSFIKCFKISLKISSKDSEREQKKPEKTFMNMIRNITPKSFN